jgi:transcription elongation factor GreA
MILKVWLRNRDIGPENDKGDRQLDHISANHLNPAGHAMIAPHGCKSMNKLPMTAAGHLALENELTHRIRVERPRLIQRIQEAIADDTNLAENSEYQAAKTEQERNEARVGELDDKLARAEIINVAKLSGDTIKFGATVTLIEEETGKKKLWQIVGEPEADAHKGKISVVSPIARALIGKSKGEIRYDDARVVRFLHPDFVEDLGRLFLVGKGLHPAWHVAAIDRLEPRRSHRRP